MLNSDLPIQKSVDDKLNRSKFAEDLAKAIINRNDSEGLVIGMYGKWGSGKTSVINMVLEQLEIIGENIRQKPVIMRFNPWLCADSKQLISEFFNQLSSAIAYNNPKLKNICGRMKDYANMFELAGNIPKIGTLIKYFGEQRSKKAEAKNNNLQGIKDEICNNLSEHKLKLIITIDDIDRLSNEEITSVFQLVKSLADFPYTTYFLAFDFEIVTRALGDIQKCDGAEYLEKIVQLPFELPMANFEDICKVFFSKLEAILGDIPECKWDKYYWNDLFNYGIRYYLNTIRDAVRFINTLSLKFSIMKDEINPIDLIGVTCLQVFEPNIYSKISFYKDVLCGTGHGGLAEYAKKELSSAWENIIRDIPEDRCEPIKNILQNLFPKLGNISNRGIFSSIGVYRNDSWRA